MHLLLPLFVILHSFLLNDGSLNPLFPSENDYTHKLIVDEDNPSQYVLFWKMINDDEIQFEAHCRTNGWLGLGISSNSGMEGADLAIGWVKDGVAVLKVRLCFSLLTKLN